MATCSPVTTSSAVKTVPEALLIKITIEIKYEKFKYKLLSTKLNSLSKKLYVVVCNLPLTNFMKASVPGFWVSNAHNHTLMLI